MNRNREVESAGSRSGSLIHTETVGIQTSASVMDSEPGSNVEIISMEEGSVQFSEELADDLIKPMDVIEENEDLLSLEAQKLTGDILHESRLEDYEDVQPQESGEKIPGNAEDLGTEPSTSQPPQQRSDKEPLDHTEQGELELQGVGLASVQSGGSISLVDAVEVGVDAAEDHDKEMTSRSSTIFVDMTGLNIESHETQA